MARGRASFRQIEVARAFRGFKKGGGGLARLEVDLETGRIVTSEITATDVVAAGAQSADAVIEEWERKRRARSA